jgi:hypothetical protein
MFEDITMGMIEKQTVPSFVIKYKLVIISEIYLVCQGKHF